MASTEQFIEIIKSEFPEDRLTYQKGIATFHPECASDASKFFCLLNLHGRSTFITAFGNNIDPVGAPFDQMVIIRTDRLNSVIEVSPGDFYIKVGAGYPLREINVHQARNGLFLPHSALPYAGSVGGAVSVNLTADHLGHDLPIKRYFIAATIVTPEGDIIKPGSVCFKSVSGYDVVKIFGGAWGLLGLLVDVTLRVMPSTAAEEFADMKMKAIDRRRFLAGLDTANQSTDAIYSRKIKNKFDPNTVLPIV